MEQDRPMQSDLKELKEVVDRHNSQGGVLFLITEDGWIETHTYGKTKKQCEVLGRWMASAHDNMFTTIPFTTVFGWGTEGKPTKITAEQWASLTDNQKQWVLSLGLTLEDDVDA